MSKIEYLSVIVERSKEKMDFGDMQWFSINAGALLGEIVELQKLTTAEIVLGHMDAMVKIAAPETQAAMQQLLDKLETVTAERDQSLAKLAEIGTNIAALISKQETLIKDGRFS